MAHKGRQYPLTRYRPFNGDAPYPLWTADRYRFHLPDATGTLFDFLSGKVYISAPGVLTPTGLLYAASDFFPLAQIQTFYDFVLNWDNADPDPRVLYFRIQVKQFPVGFPPVTVTVSEDTYHEDNILPMHEFTLPLTPLVDPSVWLPFESLHIRAQGY